MREAARKDKKQRFTALLHHVSIDRLRDSYHSLKKKAAPGVDGMTWQEYGETLEVRLADLYGRIHRGAYRAQPSRRTWIAKSDGRQRPLGIAALEDKIVQHAVGEVLSQISERTFKDSATVFDQDAGSMMHWTRYGWESCARRWAGFWTSTSDPFWIVFHTAPWFMKIARIVLAADRLL